MSDDASGPDDPRPSLKSLDNVAGIDETGFAVDAFGQRARPRPKWGESVPSIHTVQGVRPAAWTKEEWEAYQAGGFRRKRRRRTVSEDVRVSRAFCWRLLDIVSNWEQSADDNHEVYDGTYLWGDHDPATCSDCQAHRDAEAEGRCTHCHIDEARAKGICRWCADQKKNQGHLPSPEAIDRRRARREKGKP